MDLRDHFTYNPDTGVITGGNQYVDRDKRPRTGGSFGNYSNHRLAFFLMLGRWPVGEVDHIDRDKTNNRWSNLREVPRAKNLRNRGPNRNSKTGIRGVFKNGRRYTALLHPPGKPAIRKNFKTLEEAVRYREYLETLYPLV